MTSRRLVLIALGVALAVPMSQAAETTAERYAQHCASCHGADGKARTPMGKKLGAKDLAQSQLADDTMLALIRDGLRDAKGVQRMPAFKDRLSAPEISSLVTYVKSFRGK